MEPNTIRLPANTWKVLEEEASEYGFRNRSEYIRHLIEHREAILENTSANTNRIRGRLDDLEARLAEVEATVASNDAEAPSERATGGEQEPEPEPTSPPSDDAGEQADAGGLDDLLDDWRPGRTPGERREAMRAAGRAAVELLRADGGPLQRAEFEDLWEQYPVPDQAPPDENDTYWRKSLRPALQAAIEAGLARQAQGSWEYYWEGPDDDGDQDGVDAAA